MPLVPAAYEISIVLISIMLSVSAMILGLGYATDDKRLKENGKYELKQALINGAILSVLLFGFGSSGSVIHILNGLASSYVPVMQCDPILQSNYAACFAYSYLVGLSPITVGGITMHSLMFTAASMLVAFEAMYAALSLIASLTLSAGFVSIAFSTILKPVLSQLNYIISTLSAAIIGIELQAMLIKFSSAAVPTVLLPVGMVLRMVYFTRKLGGTIIAISIGIAIILPFSYIMNAWQLVNFSTAASYPTQTLMQNVSSLSDKAMTLTPNSNNTASSVLPFSKSVTKFVNYFGKIFDKIANDIAFLIIEVFFLPALGLIITAISIKEFASLLGSEISFGGLYLL